MADSRFRRRSRGGPPALQLQANDWNNIQVMVDTDMVWVSANGRRGLGNTATNDHMMGFGPIALKGSPVVIHLKVPDVDATIAQAVAAGATLTMPAADMFWGDRYGQVRDPFGHRWSIATPKQKLTPAEMQTAMEKAFGTGSPC